MLSREKYEDNTYDDSFLSETFEFTRLAKRHPQLMSLSATEAWRKIPWTMTGFDDEAQENFLDEWNRVRHVPGLPGVLWAREMSRRHPLPVEDQLTKTFGEFVSLNGWLQVSVGRHSYFLATRTAAKILELRSPSTISKLRRRAISMGLLEIAAAHTCSSATRFRFNVGRFPVLQNYLTAKARD